MSESADSVPVPIPASKEEWRPGMRCHWTEQTRFDRIKFPLYRLAAAVHLGVGIAYGVYRAMDTIGLRNPVFLEASGGRTHPALLAYHILFLALEMINFFAVFLRLIETWQIVRRKSIDFKQIPNELLATPHPFGRKRSIPAEYSNYPSVGVFIPCYKESAALVLETIIGALGIDYPPQLLTVYLCDDGQDEAKRNMVSQLRKVHSNLHYVIRPVHSHAKAGNLNYAIKRTRSDLIVTFDADFVARPQFLQRLLPYYYNFNPDTSLYEFDQSLACVQSPQHFRNLSPKDPDPLDQRATYFFEMIQPGKDFWNASTIIGTNNLLSRVPVSEVGYFPYYTVTEDTAMSMALHSRGYTTYFVNESLASGLATTSLWSNLTQRARWLKGDYQILFSWKNGPLTRKGLNLPQRLLYLHMSFSRFVSIVHLFFEIALILLLVFSISPLDIDNPIQFLLYLSAVVGTSIVLRTIAVSGSEGLGKSDAGSVAFEAVFRYYTIKHLLTVLLFGKKLKFKVTDKSDSKPVGSSTVSTTIPVPFDEDSRTTLLGARRPPRRPPRAAASRAGLTPDHSEGTTPEHSGDETGDSSTRDDESAPSGGDENEDSMGNSLTRLAGKQQGPSVDIDDGVSEKSRWQEIWKNLARVRFNILMAVVLSFSFVWAILYPPFAATPQFRPERRLGSNFVGSAFPIVLSLAFALISIIPHFVAIYLAFAKYTSGWMMRDLKNGRCDQYVEKENGELYVPRSWISLLPIVKGLILVAALILMGVYVYRPELIEQAFG